MNDAEKREAVARIMAAMRPAIERRLGGGTLAYDLADEIAERIGGVVGSIIDEAANR